MKLDDHIYVVISRWGVTIHRAVTYWKYPKGKPRELKVVQDHATCQVGRPNGILGGYYPRYIGLAQDMPPDLIPPWAEPRECQRCWDSYVSLPKKATAKELRQAQKIVEESDGQAAQ